MQQPTAVAGAYLREGKIFLHAEVRTVHGLYRFSEPVLVVDAEATLWYLGNQVFEVLSQFKDQVAHSTSRGPNPLDPLLKAAKVRSVRSFERLARHVFIELLDDEVSFSAWRWVGRGYVPVPDAQRSCAVSDRAVGETLLLAFEDCE